MIALADARSRSRSALFCAPLPPEFDKESGSRRIYHLVELLLEEGWQVAFVCENAPEDSPYVRHLRRLGVATYVGFGRHTEALLDARRFDVAVFAFWYMADRYADEVRRRSPGTRIVVETVDLHWLRGARRILGGRGGGSGRLDASFGAEFVGEINAYADADGVLTVSETEAELVGSILADPGRTHAVPDFDEMSPGPMEVEDRAGIVFVGNFRHPPNRDAVEHLCLDVLPLLPEAVLAEHPVRIVGNGPGERVHELAARSEHVQVTGWVPSVGPYLQRARISVVPLRYGAGTKRKLIQSLLAATPTVSTSVGVEGIDVEDGRHLLVADGAEELARAMVRLLADDGLWSRLAAQGRRRVRRLHGKPRSRKLLRAALDAVLARPLPADRRAAEAAGRERSPSVEGVRRAVEESLPPSSSVLVVSRGDPELVELPGYRARHFPQDADGGYAGYHPKDSRAALTHLDEVRDDSEFLVFPATSFWWLDHYAGLADHVADRCERVWADEHCMIFRLASPSEGGSRARSPKVAPSPLRRRPAARSAKGA